MINFVRLIMTGNIMAGKNNGGYKHAELPKKPPNLTRHFFACNIIFTKKYKNPPNFTCYIAIFDCVFVCSFKVKLNLKLKDYFQEN